MLKVKATGAWMTVLTLCLLTSPAGAATSKGYVLTQTGNAWGRQVVEVCPQQLRINFSRLNITLATKAPDWRIVLSNPRTKKYCELSRDEWLKLTLSRNHAGANKQVLWLFSSSGAETVGGLHTVHYKGQRFYKRIPEKNPIVPGPPKAKLLANVKDQFPQDAPKGYEIDRWKKKELWMTKDVNIAPELAAIICSGTSLSDGTYGIPIRMVEYQKDGARQLVMDTKLARKVDIPLVTQIRPAGFKKVSSFTALTASEMDERDPLADLMFMTEPTEQLPKPKKKL